MNIKPGDTVSVRHYSGINPIKSAVVDVKDNLVYLKLSKEFAAFNFLEGDPVVFGFERDEAVYVYGCNIVAIMPSEGFIELAVDKVDSGANMRQHERFPVSMYADLKIGEARKKYLATVKDISLYGIRLYAKVDLKIGEIADMSIYTDKSVMFIKSNVIRKTPIAGYFEYGMGIIYDDQVAVNTMKEYLHKLKHEEEEHIRKLRGR